MKTMRWVSSFLLLTLVLSACTVVVTPAPIPTVGGSSATTEIYPPSQPAAQPAAYPSVQAYPPALLVTELPPAAYPTVAAGSPQATFTPAQPYAYPAFAETQPVDTQPGSYPSAQIEVTTGPTQQPSPGLYTCDLKDTKLPIWRYEVVKTYPHDPESYTQGLIYRDGVLYEGSGLRGRSSLRRVELETGKVLELQRLADIYFGEGVTELNDKLYQITWQEKTGFVYDLTTLKEVGQFQYDTEGWGLTHDGQRLILSDGTDQLYFFDPSTLRLSGEVSVADDRGPVLRINELEYIEGEVWGNLYQTACIVRIDPTSGKVTGWIDLTGLHGLAQQAEAGPVPPEVPNGIAYDPATRRVFVTGKFWPTLYEITLVPVEAQP